MPFELQGHRGARGLRPENTLPSFEAALDVGVTSIETDVHLTRDGVPVLIHDPVVALDALGVARISGLTLAELRRARVAGNPDPVRFPDQTDAASPVATLFAAERGIDAYGIPALSDLFAFVAAYAGAAGERAGKTAAQRARAGRVILDVELKRVPFEPERIGDAFDGAGPALLERQVVAALQAAGAVVRSVVRSFDHRSVRAVRQLEPRLTTALLIVGTAPLAPALLAQEAGASIYCPEHLFVDAAIVREAHTGGIRVLAWTVNDPRAWERLLAWGVDGITTDYPDRLAAWLQARGVAVG